MTIEEFRKKSALGGFETTGMSDTEVLLNPKSFQAVGKVEGWDKTYLLNWREFKKEIGQLEPDNLKEVIEPQYRQYLMIDALVAGKSIEEFLATL